ncbi:hypothetical protein ACP70R_011872 [Stipagrostis hirtigluma subsp. patula]
MEIRTRRRARRRSEAAAALHQQPKKMKTAAERATTPLVSLPDDLVEEVLLRLPARSLARFRRACLSWNAVISSPGFQDRHHALAAAKFAFVPLAPRHTFAVSCMVPGAFPRPSRSVAFDCVGCPVIIGSRPCRGIVLLRRPCAGAYSVCNPTTGEVLHLPPPRKKKKSGVDDLVPGIGFDSATGEYKVVEVSANMGSLHGRVLTLGDARGWRALDAGDQAASFGFTDKTRIDNEYYVDTVFADGCIHWGFKTNCMYVDQPHGVLSFSVADESFRRVPQPPFSTADLAPYDDGEPVEHVQAFRGLGWRSGSGRQILLPVGTTLAELDGRLCVMRDVRRRNDVDGQFEVWKLQDYETGTWSLDYRVDLRAGKRQLTRPWLVAPLRYLPGDGDDGAGEKERRKLLLATTAQAAHVYDPDTKTLRTVASLAGRDDVGGGDTAQGLEDYLRLVLYQESLVRFAGMKQGKGDIEFVKLD